MPTLQGLQKILVLEFTVVGDQDRKTNTAENGKTPLLNSFVRFLGMEGVGPPDPCPNLTGLPSLEFQNQHTPHRTGECCTCFKTRFVLVRLLCGGVRCELDAWSEYTAPGSPAGRQDASMVWIDEAQAALMFAGHASATFQYFADVWLYNWPQRRWTEIILPSMDPKPNSRYGHTAAWDGESKSMYILAGRFLSMFYSDLWAFSILDSKWKQLTALVSPARAHHTTILDTAQRNLLVFGGELNSQVHGDLLRFSLADAEAQWIKSSAPGPVPRSQHTAVWAADTQVMLVFAGWNGQQYIDDLHRYDSWADRWTELPRSGGWPAARGGHAASWDPTSQRMMIVGGTQNMSNSLSYSSALLTYSLLTGAWKEEGLQATVEGPTGRTGHAIIWDSDQRGLLLFGGYNASYLQQTWRYAMSHSTSARTISCQLGRACHLNFTDVSGVLMAKRFCTDTDMLGTEPVQTFEGVATLLFLEPGHHRLCWCDTNCSQPGDFQVALSFLTVQGPYLGQSAQCQLGATCTVDAWRGVSLSINDSVVMQSHCVDGDYASFHDLHHINKITISFDRANGWHNLHIGFLNPQTILPQDVQLCWCPASSPCTSTWDFLVVALSLQISCPPGQYDDGAGSACVACPANYFCSGGTALQSCPHASMSQAGSSSLLSCRHAQHSPRLALGAHIKLAERD